MLIIRGLQDLRAGQVVIPPLQNLAGGRRSGAAVDQEVVHARVVGVGGVLRGSACDGHC